MTAGTLGVWGGRRGSARPEGVWVAHPATGSPGLTTRTWALGGAGTERLGQRSHVGGPHSVKQQTKFGFCQNFTNREISPLPLALPVMFLSQKRGPREGPCPQGAQHDQAPEAPLWLGSHSISANGGARGRRPCPRAGALPATDRVRPGRGGGEQ